MWARILFWNCAVAVPGDFLYFLGQYIICTLPVASFVLNLQLPFDREEKIKGHKEPLLSQEFYSQVCVGNPSICSLSIFIVSGGRSIKLESFRPLLSLVWSKWRAKPTRGWRQSRNEKGVKETVYHKFPLRFNIYFSQIWMALEWQALLQCRQDLPVHEGPHPLNEQLYELNSVKNIVIIFAQEIYKLQFPNSK